MVAQVELSSAALELCRDPGDPHIVIAMSGGVDSSVAAVVLKRAGYRVSALFMKNWNEPNAQGHCEWEGDVSRGNWIFMEIKEAGHPALRVALDEEIGFGNSEIFSWWRGVMACCLRSQRLTRF